MRAGALPALERSRTTTEETKAMSTNNNCMMVEESPGKWFYLLENYNAPKNAWDWRQHAVAYGPFASMESADAHLSDNHANPGGFSVITHDRFKRDEVIDALLLAAPPRTAELRRRNVGAIFGLPAGCVFRIGGTR
jgi:hypothetical protein